MPLPRRASASARQILPNVPLSALEASVLQVLSMPLGLLSTLRILKRRQYVKFRGQADMDRLFVRPEWVGQVAVSWSSYRLQSRRVDAVPCGAGSPLIASFPLRFSLCP